MQHKWIVFIERTMINAMHILKNIWYMNSVCLILDTNGVFFHIYNAKYRLRRERTQLHSYIYIYIKCIHKNEYILKDIRANMCWRHANTGTRLHLPWCRKRGMCLMEHHTSHMYICFVCSCLLEKEAMGVHIAICEHARMHTQHKSYVVGFVLCIILC